MYSTNLDLILSFSLTILVILILIGLGFSSLCSCLRRRQPHSPHHPTPPSTSTNTHLLNSFPIIIYESTPHSSPSKSPPTCSICLGEFERGDEVRVLPKCSHVFHRICIDEWLPVKSLQCPVCRSFAIEEEGNGDGGEGVRRMNCVNNRRVEDNGSVSRSSTSLSISFGVTSLHHASIL